MLLGTGFVFLSGIRREMSGASRSCS